MNMVIQATEVFTPNDFPAHTYVERENKKFEHRLRDALTIPKMAISISGPSKSGKTMLVQKAVGIDNLIKIAGPQITSPGKLWELALDWMGAPATSSKATMESSTNGLSSTIGAEASLPFIGKVSANAGAQGVATNSNTNTITSRMGGLAQVVREIANSPFILFIDDFHYIPSTMQADVAKEIKTAIEYGVRICTASVPHRSEDVVRANPELRGRVFGVDLAYWNLDELLEIGKAGFSKLNAQVDQNYLTKIANEACGSPQLMQSLCLQTCFVMGLRQKAFTSRVLEIDSHHYSEVIQNTAYQCDYNALVEQMHRGPKLRGQERKVFEFVDGTKGDVYRAILLAISKDPPQLAISYNQLTDRVSAQCTGDVPSGSSCNEACKQIANFARALYPTQIILEWDQEGITETLNISDPYFMYFLRCSEKLKKLAS